MDGTRFDALTTQLATTWPRRRLTATLAALLAGAVSAGAATAACKKVGKNCDKNKDCCDGAECKRGECRCKPGRDECSGKCFNLDTDEKHCGRCNRTCDAGESCRNGSCKGGNGGGDACDPVCTPPDECLAGVCTPPPDTCPADAAFCSLEGPVYTCGASGTNCACSPTTEETVRCGDLTTEGAVCGQCRHSSDCVELGFGVDAFCAKSIGDCCGPTLDNVCRRPCPA